MLLSLLLALQIIEVKTVTTKTLPDARIVQTDAEVFTIEDGRVTVQGREDTRVLSSEENTWSRATKSGAREERPLRSEVPPSMFRTDRGSLGTRTVHGLTLQGHLHTIHLPNETHTIELWVYPSNPPVILERRFEDGSTIEEQRVVDVRRRSPTP